MEEIKIGEIFQVGRTRLRCVKGVGCKNCFFDNTNSVLFCACF